MAPFVNPADAAPRPPGWPLAYAEPPYGARVAGVALAPTTAVAPGANATAPLPRAPPWTEWPDDDAC